MPTPQRDLDSVTVSGTWHDAAFKALESLTWKAGPPKDTGLFFCWFENAGAVICEVTAFGGGTVYGKQMGMPYTIRFDEALRHAGPLAPFEPYVTPVPGKTD